MFLYLWKLAKPSGGPAISKFLPKRVALGVHGPVCDTNHSIQSVRQSIDPETFWYRHQNICPCIDSNRPLLAGATEVAIRYLDISLLR